MKTLVLYNSPFNWLNTFYNYGFFASELFSANNIIDQSSKTKNAYILKYRIVGFRKKDLKMSINSGVLSIEGEIETYKPKLFKKADISYRNLFIKQVSISNDMDIDNIKARFRNGILNIEISRRKDLVNYREIPVSAKVFDNSVVFDKSKKVWSKIKKLFR